jgi:Zn-dependent M28 family amino/carboxypeptidase
MVLVLVLGGCADDSGDNGSAAATSEADTTTSTSSTTEAPPSDEGSIYEEVLVALADDALEGRAHLTAGSEAAQEYLVEQLAEIAEPLVDGYRQPFDEGTNLLGIIPGTERAGEHLILGAHYDGLGRDCPSAVPGDDICNGATDNAAGVAAVLEIGRRIAADGPPRRSVVLALWDAEEPGLFGSRHYVANPVVPLDATIAYLNWDILGANLLPSLRDVSILIGVETGGERMAEAARAATSGATLDHLELSLVFGQGRSDHAPFAAAGVPIAFFTDATSGCYHTAQDDLDAVDLDKLAHQIDTGEALVRALLDDDGVPTFVRDAPTVTFGDAQAMLEVVRRAQVDLDRFPSTGRATAERFLADLEAITAAGSDAFDEASVGTLLGGSVALVELLAAQDCDGHVTPGGGTGRS